MKTAILLLTALFIFSSTILGQTCYPPTLTNVPDSIIESHCNILNFDFDGQLYVLDNQSNPLLFYSNIGEIDSLTGLWTYEPQPEDVHNPPTLEIYLSNGTCEDTTVIPLVITNDVPEITNAPSIVNMGMYFPVIINLEYNDMDICDNIIWRIQSTGLYATIDSLSGELYMYAVGNPGINECIIEITDGIDTSNATIVLEVITLLPTVAMIEQKTIDAIQGLPVEVEVLLNPSIYMTRADLSIAYEKEILNLNKITPSEELMNVCDWEYFTYKIILDNPDPSLAVVKISLIGSLDNSLPYCYGNIESNDLVTFEFLTTNYGYYDCYSSPVRFYWDDGDDNTFYTDVDHYRLISQLVFNEDPIYDPLYENNIANPETGYPTLLGAQNSDCCDNLEYSTSNFLLLINGSVDFVCVDSFSTKCDLNLNSIPFEVSDLVLYISFFVYGISVFDININTQISYSDVNKDGLFLSIADLKFLMNIVSGFSHPFPKKNSFKANIKNKDGTLSVSNEMGVAFVKAKGDITPILLADNMQMQYHFDESANETRILIYNMTEPEQTFVGDFIDIGDAQINYIEMTTYDAQKVEVSIQPTSFHVSQNYPNPFNPTTTIKFSLPQPGEVSLSIYNINGQLLETKTSTYESAGEYQFEWDGTDYSSGVYFYKLSFENFEQTKKMILIK